MERVVDRSLRRLAVERLDLEEIGGWAVHQRILSTMRAIADEQGVDVAAVAVRFVLDQPGAAPVITGAGRARQVASTMRAFRRGADRCRPRPDPRRRRRRSRPPGDVYDMDGDQSGRHGRIMKYGLQNAT